ncbi:hypothetical protein PTKU15_24780 [Paraburkholderia terrae]|nr:hypothetical protein PTKU15_24780 [Paraburkholderia terrae]
MVKIRKRERKCDEIAAPSPRFDQAPVQLKPDEKAQCPELDDRFGLSRMTRGGIGAKKAWDCDHLMHPLTDRDQL